MKLKHVTFITIAAGTMLAVPAWADDDRRDRGFYLDASVGPAFTGNVAATVPTFGPAAKTTFDLDTGFHFSAAMGYRLLDWLAIEGETGVTANGFQGLVGDGVLSHVPLLANAVFRCPHLGKWEPFAGFGLGGALSSLSIDRAILTPGGPVLDGSDTDAVFAWQVLAGIRYHFHERMSVGATYKFLHTDDAVWKVKGLGRIAAEGVSSHSISANFSFQF